MRRRYDHGKNPWSYLAFHGLYFDLLSSWTSTRQTKVEDYDSIIRLCHPLIWSMCYWSAKTLKNYNLFPWPYGTIVLSRNSWGKLTDPHALDFYRFWFLFTLMIIWYDHDIIVWLLELSYESLLFWVISSSILRNPRHDHHHIPRYC